MAWLIVFANVARVVSFPTPWWRGGARWTKGRPSDVVGETLNTIRDHPARDLDLRKQAHTHWQARARSAYHLGTLKGNRLALSLVGFAGPAMYFADRLLS